MAKVLLVDFYEEDRDYLVARNFDIRLIAARNFSENKSAFDESDVVFIYAGKPETSAEECSQNCSTDLAVAINKKIENGNPVFLFMGESGPTWAEVLLSDCSWLKPEKIMRQERLKFNPKALLYVPFERYKLHIQEIYKLATIPIEEGNWFMESVPGKTIEVMAKSVDGFPVSFILKKGRGYYFVLPSFGSKNSEIISFLLRNKVSLDNELREVDMMEWLDGEEYSFPEIKELLLQKEQEVRRHELALAELDRLIQEAKKVNLEIFHKLLVGDGPELKNAVLNAFRYLGWARVVDVDEYWKNVIRDHEESIWLVDSENTTLEASLRHENLILVVIRTDKNWATDEDCLLLQKFKGRRMQEFENTRMKALLVGNYYNGVEPKMRQNPFSAVQIEEAIKDGNALLTTWELFRAIKAEKEKRLSKDFIREVIKTKKGLLEFGL